MQGSSPINPNYFIFQLHSSQLNYDITHNFKSFNQNTTEEILHKFQRFDQSNMSKDRPSAITTPFDIDIHAISLKKSESNGNRKRGHPGAGRSFKRLQPIDFEIDLDGLFRLNNDDQYCLFRAIIFTIAHTVLPKQRFFEFKNDEREQAQKIKEIMATCGIQRGLPFYDIEDIGDLVQELYLNVAYPGQFKIFAFENQGLMKPFYQSNAQNYIDPLCIFYWIEDAHYDPIRSMKKLLGNNSRYNYCFAVIFPKFQSNNPFFLQCEIPYKSAIQHRMKCKAKCFMCSRVGPSFPCCNEDYNKFCQECGKTFKNYDCFNYHIEKNICEKSKKCLDCGIIYRVDVRLIL